MLSANNPTSKYGWLSDSFLLVSGLILFYFFWLGNYPLFTPDEGRYSEVAREMLSTGDFITPRVNGVAFLDKPALYYWLQAIAMNFLGVNEWAVRFFPALLGIFGSLLMYVAGRLLFNRRTGLLSAIILATIPLYFANAHYADLNLEVAFFISATLLLFLLGITRTDKWRSPLLYAAYIAGACAFLTKGLIGFVFPSMIIGSWIILLWRWQELKQMHLVRGSLLFLLLSLPWYVLVQKANPDFFHYFFVVQQVTRFLSAATFNNASPFWFYLPIILLGAFPWTIFIIQAFYFHVRNYLRSPKQHANELYLMLWFLLVLIFFSIPRTKTVGYILPVFPPLALLTGHYLSTIWDKAQSKSIYFAIFNFAICSILLSALLLSLPHTEWIKVTTRFIPYLTLLAFIFITSAITTFIFIKSKNLLALFCITTTCSILFSVTLITNVKYLNDNSIKPLALQLKTIMKPNDEVLTYFRFYQDIPMYLERRISIVADWNSPTIAEKDNWQRELWLGMPFQKTDDWLITKEVFWQRWNSNKHLFVFTSEDYLDDFKNQKKYFTLLGKYNNVVLITNTSENF